MICSNEKNINSEVSMSIITTFFKYSKMSVKDAINNTETFAQEFCEFLRMRYLKAFLNLTKSQAKLVYLGKLESEKTFLLSYQLFLQKEKTKNQFYPEVQNRNIAMARYFIDKA